MKSLLVLSAEENAESMGCHQFRSVADPNGRCDPCMRRKRGSKPHSPASAVGPATGPAASVRPHTLTSSPPIMDIVSDTVRYISSAHSLPTFNHLLIVHKLPSSFLPFPLSLYPHPPHPPTRLPTFYPLTSLPPTYPFTHSPTAPPSWLILTPHSPHHLFGSYGHPPTYSVDTSPPQPIRRMTSLFVVWESCIGTCY